MRSCFPPECADLAEFRAVPLVDGVSIVLVGSFNPRIFHPGWFEGQQLIGPREAQAAAESDDLIVTTQFSRFVADWLLCTVFPEKLELSTLKADAVESLRDVAQGALGILEHTPVQAFGLNRNVHYQLPTEEGWHRLGDTLVPKEFWSSVLPGHVGMQSLSVLGEPRTDPKGQIRVTTEPSVEFHPGVYISINDHYIVPPQDDRDRSDSLWAADMLGKVWSDSLGAMQQIVERIVKLGV